MAERPTVVGSDADLELVTLRTGEQIEAAAELLWTVWRARTLAERAEVVSTSLLRTLSHSGNYVVGAYRGGKLLGCTVGMFGALAESGRPDSLHSYLAGVSQTESDRGIGYAMKRHQRQWALEREIETITWTFDPLVARNAYFNLCKLGATAVTYKENFYGTLNDGANTDEDTDRLLVSWPLRSEWVERAMLGEEGEMRRHPRVMPEAELIVVPEDISKLRVTAREQAREERLTVRKRFLSLLAQGYHVAGMTKGREYVLVPAGTSEVFES